MTKNKKTLLIILGSIIWLFIIVFSVKEVTRIVSENSVRNNMGPFDSFDGTYTLYLEEVTIDSVLYTGFFVEEKSSGLQVYKSSSIFETSKLRYITWKENSLDIIVMTSQEFVTFEYGNNTWVAKD